MTTPRHDDTDAGLAILAALRTERLTTMPPTDFDALHARISDSITTGRTSPLPIQPNSRHTSVKAWAALAAAAVIAAFALLPAPASEQRDSQETGVRQTAASPLDNLASWIDHWRAPTYPRVLTLDPSRVPNGRYVWSRRVFLDGEHADSAGDLTLDLSTMSTDASDRVMVRHDRDRVYSTVSGRYEVTAPTPLEGDTVLLHERTLSAIAHRAWSPVAFRTPAGPRQLFLAEEFTNDSIIRTRMDRLDDRCEPLPAPALRTRSYATARQATVVAMDASTLLPLVAGLPLARDWNGTVLSVRSVYDGAACTGRMVYEPLHLRVAGDSTITSRWGKESSWRLLVGTGEEAETWWVSRTTGQVLLVQISPGQRLMTELSATQLPGR